MKTLRGLVMGFSVFCLFILGGCSVAKATPTDEEPNQKTISIMAGTNTPLEDALEALIQQGDMTEQEKQAVMDFVGTVGPGEDPIRLAVDQGLLTRAQAQALGQWLGPKPEDEATQSTAQGAQQEAFSVADLLNSVGTRLSVQQANDIEQVLLQKTGYTSTKGGYPVVDTGQTSYYSSTGKTGAQNTGDTWYGQDASYTGNAPSYTDNGDGTVTDNVTGLMWQQDPGDKMTWAQAVENMESFELAGYDDWRLPTIKELYSLIQFTGRTRMDAESSIPYINTDYFAFTYGDETDERMIDSQYATSTIYESDTMNSGNTTMFGVNFADGRIKGYPIDKTFYVMYVRGNTHYGMNSFVDNGDGTITDEATGLMWMQYDSGYFGAGDGIGGMTWEEALDWAENLDYAGYDDWALPDAKQLQSIVDYEKSPDTTQSAAIDPMFQATEIKDISGKPNYGWYWSGTTHLDGKPEGSYGIYVAFGDALGEMNGIVSDVHGAGAQRSDPKNGNATDYPAISNAPQGDVRRVYNMVRLVRVAD